MSYEEIGGLFGSAVAFAVIALVVYNVLKHKSSKAKSISILTFVGLFMVRALISIA